MNVLLTHSEGRLGGLAAALREQGFSVAHRPFIRTEFLPADEALTQATKLREVDWLLFSSRTAVQAWVDLGLALDTYNIGAVGQRTAAEIAKSGGTVLLTATPENAEGLLSTFSSRISPPQRVGLPCGEQALPTLSAGLRNAGFTVMRAVLYRTTTCPLTRIEADLIVVASPSAVAALPPEPSEVQLIALGPSTAHAARARGLHVTEAQTPDVGGVVRAVLEAAPVAT